MDSFLLIMAAAAVLSLILTFLARHLAIRIGALDRPVERSVHTEPKPYLGGVAIYVAFAATVLFFVGTAEGEVNGILVGGLFIVAVGIIDDFFRLSPKVKLLSQVAAAFILIYSGVQIYWLTNPFGGLIIVGDWGIPLTVFWVVAVINVVNLIDGLDGLAAGISSIAAVTLLFVAIEQGQALAVILTAALAGSALGFLPLNFNPAKIFMGDAGSMFLGYALAAVSITGTLKSATAVALIVPVLALGVPIIDTFFAIVRRLANGRPIVQADREHLHHRLLQRGLSQRQTVMIMYLISAWFGFNAVLLWNARDWFLVLGPMILLSGLLLHWARRAGILTIRTGKDISR